MRKIVAEALFAEANAITEAVYELMAEFETVSADLVALGYDEMPHRTCFSSGYCDIDSDFLDEIAANGPTAPVRGLKQAAGSQRASVSAKTRIALGKHFNWTCLYCCETGTESLGPDGRRWHVDHVYPVSRGGDSLDDNLVLACATCNLQKKALLMLEFIQSNKKPKLAGMHRQIIADESAARQAAKESPSDSAESLVTAEPPMAGQ